MDTAHAEAVATAAAILLRVAALELRYRRQAIQRAEEARIKRAPIASTDCVPEDGY